MIIKSVNKKLIIAIIPALLFIMMSSCSREQLKSIKVKRNFAGSLWVVRHNIATSGQIDELLKTAKRTGIKNLFVQVRGRGDAYYNSSFEPSAIDVPEGFDPLKYLIEKTKGTDIRIHAWVNISFVLNPENYPPDTRHILAKHPEWVTYDYKGRPMTDYSEAEIKENLLEGYCLDPAIPEVKEFTRIIIKDIISKYQVDGIHLDFIRYPYSGFNSYYNRYLSDFGYNPIARKIFKSKHGIDPLNINPFKDSRGKKLFDRFRVEQINDIVKIINDTVKNHNPYLSTSAAVMPRYDWGKRVYFQDWPSWLEKNIIDFVCVMSYTADMNTFNSFINSAINTNMKHRILMGVRIDHDKTPLSIARDQIQAVYDNEFRGFIIFSFEHDRKYLQNISEAIKYDRYVYRLVN